jgi:hypothetical protein
MNAQWAGASWEEIESVRVAIKNPFRIEPHKPLIIQRVLLRESSNLRCSARIKSAPLQWHKKHV